MIKLGLRARPPVRVYQRLCLTCIGLDVLDYVAGPCLEQFTFLKEFFWQWMNKVDVLKNLIVLTLRYDSGDWNGGRTRVLIEK